MASMEGVMFPLPCSMPSPYTPCQIPQSGPLHASPSMLAMSSVHVEPAWNSLCAQEASACVTLHACHVFCSCGARLELFVCARSLYHHHRDASEHSEQLHARSLA